MAVLRADFMSYSLKRIVPITVVLPCDTTNFRNLGPVPAKPPYKTLYLLHGIYGSDIDWLTSTNIQRLARERQIAVVMPAGENHFYTDSGIQSQEYGSFIGEELIDVTRRMFPLSHKREDTYIAGFSMGGYGAFMNGLKYHETFSHIACLSMAVIDPDAVYTGIPPMDDPAFFESVFGTKKLNQNLKSQKSLLEFCLSKHIRLPELYFTVGNQDILYQPNTKFHEYLLKQGVRHIFTTSDGFHNFEFCNHAIKDILNWLPGGESLN